ncbi:MAG: hypothetical protein QOG52_1687 [Frankiaceae bacterium]|nr:hypothetical protein [Frankiaceae bacterium]
MIVLPDRLRDWLSIGPLAVIGTVDLGGHARLSLVRAARDGDDIVMPVLEGSPPQLDLIYEPAATVLFWDPDGGPQSIEVRGEVEMTTAGAAELAAGLTRARRGPDESWLVVRVVPTAVEMRG